MGRLFLLLLLSPWGLLPAVKEEPLHTYAVLVHRNNQNESVPVKELKRLFSGESLYWPNHARVVLVHRDPGSTAHAFVLRRLLGTTANEYRRWLIGVEFTGAEPVIVKTLHTDAAACKYVFNVPGAITIVEANAASLPECAGVKTLKVNGKVPGEKGYPLQ